MTSANTSPVCGSIAIIAPLRSPMAASAALWISRSMVSFSPLAGYRRLAAQNADFPAVAVHNHVV